MQEEYITPKEASEIVGTAIYNIWALLREGKIPGAKKEYGRVWLVPKKWAEMEKLRRAMKPKVYKQAAEEGVSPQAIYQRMKRQKIAEQKIINDGDS